MYKKNLGNIFLLFMLICLYAFTFPKVNIVWNKVVSPPVNWVGKVGARQIPEGEKVFRVNDYGAVNDGRTMDTKFIQKTIDACAAAGGGIVTFDTGAYLTGSIFIKSGVTLQIDRGVKILGSHDIKDYPIIPTRVAGVEMKWPAALINVLGQKDVAIIGNGLVDGRGKPFWEEYWAMRKVYDPKGIRWAADYDCRRPRLLLISRSSDVTLKDIHLQRSGFWTVHILYSDHITVNGVIVENNIGGHGPSTDGIDIDSSTYILVENCDIDCNDDDYCLKAGRDADGLRVNLPTEYVVIRHCIARSGSGLCTFGSETSGSIRHILVEDSKAVGTKNGVKFKSAFTRGGTVEDIHIQNLKMEEVKTVININLNWNPDYSYPTLPKGYNYDSIPPYWKVILQKVPPSKGTPTIQHIYINNIDADNCRTAIHAVGMKTSPLKDFVLKDVKITAGHAGEIEYAKNWHFINVDINAKDNNKVQVMDAVNVNL